MKAYENRIIGTARRVLPRSVKGFARKVYAFIGVLNARIRLGRGVRPLSYSWGNDRGLPICRYYLAQFLQEFATDIKGNCLEFQDDKYTSRFGKAAVTKLDILHIDDSNSQATIVADITKGHDIPSDYFDCIICTHVLNVIFELDKAVSELHRILKPGGVLLVAVPQVSMYDAQCHEMWRFTPQGLSTVLAKEFGFKNLTVQAYGNSLTAAGQIRGLASHEFGKAELDTHDERFAVEVCARAIKRTD